MTTQFENRVEIVRALLRSIAQSYHFYFKYSDFVISEVRISDSCIYFHLKCPTSDALAAAFILVSNVINEHSYIASGEVITMVEGVHNCLNPNYDPKRFDD